MNSIPKEKLLAEALEEKEQRIEELTGKVNTLTKENKTLSAKLKTLSENPKGSPTPQSIVTWKDHQATIDAYVNKQEAMAQEIAELKSKITNCARNVATGPHSNGRSTSSAGFF